MTSSGPLKVVNDDEEIDMPLNLLEKDYCTGLVLP